MGEPKNEANFSYMYILVSSMHVHPSIAMSKCLMISSINRSTAIQIPDNSAREIEGLGSRICVLHSHYRLYSEVFSDPILGIKGVDMAPMTCNIYWKAWELCSIYMYIHVHVGRIQKDTASRSLYLRL